MKFEELDPILQEVLLRLEKASLFKISDFKITRLKVTPKVEKNVTSKQYISFIFPEQAEKLHRRLWYRILYQCKKYMQFNTLNKMFASTKENLNKENPTPPMTSSAKFQSHFDQKRLGSNSSSMFDFRLPEGLDVKFSGDTRIHRIRFSAKKHGGRIPVDSSLYRKLKSKISDFSLQNSINWLKLEDFTVGLSTKGKLQLFVKCTLENARDKFVHQFRFLSHEEATLFLQSLKPTPELEVAAPYIKGVDYLKDAKVKVTIPGGIGEEDRVVWLWEDGSDTVREIDVRGEGRTSYNLALLIADRLRMIRFFDEVREFLAKIQNLLKFNTKLMLSDA